ncbi:MAG: aspartate/glutamate racemase family protein [Anaerolineae bacterium]|nr:aspartate/glutamate racemase family protein [Anaerolineae bacterium]
MQYTIVPLKTIGILGGMSTEATREYYQLINAGVQALKGEHNGAELIIYSVNFQNIERLIRTRQWEAAGDYLAQKAKQLEAGGAEYLFLATNTLHIVRDAITSAISIPFIDIFEVAARAVQQQGLRKVGLLGTYPVMTDVFYQQAYQAHNISVLTPSESEKREIDRIIFDEMCHHQFLPASKQYFIDTVGRLRDQGAEGVILGCTEIKMLVNQADFSDFPVFDTTTLHCEKAVRLCVGIDDS